MTWIWGLTVDGTGNARAGTSMDAGILALMGFLRRKCSVGSILAVSGWEALTHQPDDAHVRPSIDHKLNLLSIAGTDAIGDLIG
jgi:hypothetical protein